MAADDGFRVDRQPLPPHLHESVDRLHDLPNDIWACEACGSDDAMLVARSTFPAFGVDEVTLVCVFCRYSRTHELSVADPDQFERERQLREREYGSRTIDINEHRNHIDAPRSEVKARLRDLGYYE